MGLYSAWPLVGGALSKAIGESFSGLTAGGLQGEEVRHKRAGETLQQQYLEHAMQQLANQQAFQQGTLGWHAMQIAENARRDRATEAQRAETAADTRGWRDMQTRRWDMQDSAAAEERGRREARDRADAQRWERADELRESEGKANRAEKAREADAKMAARWADVGVRAKRASDASQKALTGSTALNQQQKLQLAQLSMTSRRLRQEAAFANQAAQLGQKPPRDLAKIEAELAQVETAIEEMANQAGGGAAAPKAPDAASVAKKWGLQ